MSLRRPRSTPSRPVPTTTDSSPSSSVGPIGDRADAEDPSSTAPAELDPLGPALEFMQRVWGLNHALEQLSSKMDRHLGMTAQQRLIIRCVGKRPGIGAGELASLMRVDPGTVSAALNRLESKGLIQRTRMSSDLRRVVVRLTPEGSARNEPKPGTVEAAVDRVLADVTDTDLRATERVLERLVRALDEEARAAYPATEST